MQITDTADNERWKQALHGTFKSLGDDLFLRSTFKADLVLQPGSMENYLHGGDSGFWGKLLISRNRVLLLALLYVLPIYL